MATGQKWKRDQHHDGFKADARRGEIQVAQHAEARQTKAKSDHLALLEARSRLPISQYATTIRLALHGSRDVLVLSGETGSGKSTQVPQFLSTEPWCSGLVGITQPRRVAAISLAQRVALEMGTTLGNTAPTSKVGYAVRFDYNVSPATKIKFMTDGMLLQELLADKWLKRYSVIIIDEVHERGINVDLLLGFLKRILVHQSTSTNSARGSAGRLKVVVMSATGETEKLFRFFDDASPTATNGTAEAADDEWSGISSSDEDVNGSTSHDDTGESIISAESDFVSTCHVKGRQHPVDTFYAPAPHDDFVEAALKTIFQINYKEPLPGDILVFVTGQETVEALESLVKEYAAALKPEVPKLLVLPLFAALSQDAQSHVFDTAPPRTRKVIISTNIAETSVTIPGVVHVIDSGLAKVKEYRSSLSLDSLLIKPISKSSAIQRKGRAGRERPGKCWRLYTEQDYLKLEETTTPEILRCDLTWAYLTIKARGVDDVLNFPMVDRPPRESIRRALGVLHRLHAIDDGCNLTSDGRKMARLPLPPMLSCVLMEAGRVARDDGDTQVVPCAVDIVAALTVENLFPQVQDERMTDAVEAARRELLHRDGDHLTFLNAVRGFLAASGDRRGWCERHLVNFRAMKSAVDARRQLRKHCADLGLLEKRRPQEGDSADDMAVGAETAERVVRCFVRGFAGNSALLMPDGAFRTVDGNQAVLVHPGSVLHGRRVQGIIYNELVYTSRCYARGVSAIKAGWLDNALAPPQQS